MLIPGSQICIDKVDRPSNGFYPAINDCMISGMNLPDSVAGYIMYANRIAIGGFRFTNYWSGGQLTYMTIYQLDMGTGTYSTDSYSQIKPYRCVKRL